MHVYVVEGGYRHIKVGISRNMHNRLIQIQTGCPFPVKLASKWETPYARKVEKAAHKVLKKYRATGEWFILPANVGTAVVETLISAEPRPRNNYMAEPLPAVVFCGNCGHHNVMRLCPKRSLSFRCIRCEKRDRIHVIDL